MPKGAGGAVAILAIKLGESIPAPSNVSTHVNKNACYRRLP